MIKVYTAITGGYDALRPTAWASTCLTDVRVKAPRKWKRKVFAVKGLSPRRMSRHPKMMPHLYFPDAEYTLYLDGNINLLCDPRDLVTKYLAKWDLAMFPHPQRKCIYHEARAVVRRKKESKGAVQEQIDHYLEVGFPRNFGLTACYVILRRNTPEIRALGKLWWEAYLRWTERDQLSFDFARWLMGTEYEPLEGNLLKAKCKCFRRVKHT